MSSRQHLFDIFNQFLRLARTAKLQYEQHLTRIDHEPALDIIADIINEENQHIEWLVTAIEDGGGTATVDHYDIAMPEVFEHMVRADYDLESQIISEYELHLEEIWDPQLRSLAEVILKEALRHREEFRGLLEDFGTDELMDVS